MTESAPAMAAILTGDLIGSTRAAPRDVERAIETLAGAARVMSGWMPQAAGAGTRFTRYRGDGWQMYLAAPELALRATLCLGAELRAMEIGLDTRVAIGVGRVESLGTASLADARGAAFEFSGHALDNMSRGRRLEIDGAGVTGLHRAVVDLLDERSARWTRQQAEAMRLALDPGSPTGAEIAGRFRITAQAVNYRLTGAGAPAIRRALEAWEAEVRNA